jgi:hypothetical protein
MQEWREVQFLMSMVSLLVCSQDLCANEEVLLKCRFSSNNAIAYECGRVSREYVGDSSYLMHQMTGTI